MSRAMVEDVEIIPQELIEEAEGAIRETLPGKSRRIYEKTLSHLLTWMRVKRTNSFSETVLLAYFRSLATTFDPSTLWSKYSMIKKMLLTDKRVDISDYHQLTNFIRRRNFGHQKKKSHVFSAPNIQNFLFNAPDSQYLDKKVCTIFGICGTCRREKLHNVTTSDVVNRGIHLIITIPNTKTHIPRVFTISDEFCGIVKKYMKLRPSHANTDRFFLNYSIGKCYNQPIGLNQFGKMPQSIAKWLHLEDPQRCTGHFFQKNFCNFTC
ncbi:hypothetical protein QAD02_010993 [Eretmocerus hayati]|uniref:Uncharacterized protein n=1 Tax=Eretmocerus hayati TaxID=131215 RepID=A0ACC2NYD3_9HYME|nr:hypothetical protein QAD02_010993 [Eretmocerus hayati]